MAGVHARCRNTVMTSRAETGSIDACVVETRVIPVIGGVMTGIALIIGLDMAIVLAGCTNTIMASRAQAGSLNARMVETDYIPICRSGMTQITGLIGNDMGLMLSRRLHPIVTAGAGTRHYLAVIETNLIP